MRILLIVQENRALRLVFEPLCDRRYKPLFKSFCVLCTYIPCIRQNFRPRTLSVSFILLLHFKVWKSNYSDFTKALVIPSSRSFSVFKFNCYRTERGIGRGPRSLTSSLLSRYIKTRRSHFYSRYFQKSGIRNWIFPLH
jgi:hypothetical protein